MGGAGTALEAATGTAMSEVDSESGFEVAGVSLAFGVYEGN